MIESSNFEKCLMLFENSSDVWIEKINGKTKFKDEMLMSML